MERMEMVANGCVPFVYACRIESGRPAARSLFRSAAARRSTPLLFLAYACDFSLD